jgi:predicted ATP-dependent endonuclease of OLD family
MKIKKIRMINFKRFDDLTIDLSKNNYKLVVGFRKHIDM